MNNNLFKKISFSFIMFLLLVSINNVQALTITESTNPNDGVDLIIDGSIIIGNTRFSPNRVITADDINRATGNARRIDPASDVSIYYYLFQEWVGIDSYGRSEAIFNDNTLSSLNMRNIIYVNNVEKMLSFSYGRTPLKDSTLEVIPGYEVMNEGFGYRNGDLHIPATLLSFKVVNRNTKTGKITILDEFKKNSIEVLSYQVIPFVGTISKGDNTGGELEYTVDGSSITINGNIKWYGSDMNAQNGRIAGNYASVMISAPDVYSKEELIANAKVKIDDRDVISWNDVIDASLGEDTYFVFYPRFDSNTRSHIITIEWEDGNTQVFTIVLDEKVTLEVAPSGNISKGDVNSYDLVYDIADDTVTINGILKWYKIGEALGYFTELTVSGNYASVLIQAPAIYSISNYLYNDRIKIDGESINTGELDGNFWVNGSSNLMLYYPRFDSDTRSHVITIEWEKGNTQVLTIDLDDKATLESPTLGYISKGDTTGGYLEYVVDGDTIAINGDIKWYGSDPDAITGRGAGNYASIFIRTPKIYSNDDLIANATVKVDDGEVISWKDTNHFTSADGTYYLYYPRFDSSTRSHVITIEWEDGNTQVFTINLDKNATLEESKLGTISKGDTTGGNLEYTIDDDTITINGDIKWYGSDIDAQNGRIAGNYASVMISASDKYSKEELIANAKVKIDDRSIVSWSDVIDTSLGEDTYFVFYPRFDGSTRSHIITIEWEEGNTQVFTINLNDMATLERAPYAVLEEYTDVDTGGEYTYDIDSSTLTIDGTIKKNISPSGEVYNYVAFRVIAPSTYTEEDLMANTKVIHQNDYSLNWSDYMDLDSSDTTSIVLYITLEEGISSVEFSVEWDSSNTQAFTINFGENLVLGP